MDPLSYEWYCLVTYDVHTKQRGQMVARRRLPGIIDDGLGIYTGVNYFGIQDEPNVHPDFGERRDFSNLNLVPDMRTAAPALRSTGGRGRVAHVLCDLQHLDGAKDDTAPRAVAQAQLARLAAHGLEVRTAAEVEFCVTTADGAGNFAHDGAWASVSAVEDNMGLLLELTDELTEAGVAVDCVQAEAGPGQLEVTFDVLPGLQGPDTTARFKNCAKTFFKSRDLQATFMTKMAAGGVASGMHLNHSLWRDGANAFHDAAAPDKMSALCRHWLAGLVHHAPALTALCCPTLNCYRRLGQPWAPTRADWGVQNRLTSYRVKVEGRDRDNVYLENRLPSAAASPYLALAATVAAGLDGLQRELALPPPASPAAPALPATLADALTALETDDVIQAALGPALVRHFAHAKRTWELQPRAGLGADAPEGQVWGLERRLYFRNA